MADGCWWQERGDGKEGEVRVRLRMAAQTLPPAPSRNAICEIRGRELPDEVLLQSSVVVCGVLT